MVEVNTSAQQTTYARTTGEIIPGRTTSLEAARTSRGIRLLVRGTVIFVSTCLPSLASRSG